MLSVVDCDFINTVSLTLRLDRPSLPSSCPMSGQGDKKDTPSNPSNPSQTPSTGEGADEEEIFIDCGASPELRRSTRTSGRKRSSTGGLQSLKPKKKMSIRSTAEVPDESGERGGVPAAQSNPFSSLAPAQATADPLIASMQAMLTGMEGRLNVATANLQASVTVKIDGAMAAIGDLRTRVDKHEERIGGLIGEVTSMVGQRVQEEMKKIQNSEGPSGPRSTSYESDFPAAASLSQEFDDSPRRYSSSYATALASNPPAEESRVLPSISRATKIESDYWRARNALRLRPIPLGNDLAGVTTFLRDTLSLGTEVIDSLGQLRTERIPYGPKSKQKNEVLVRFASTEARDVVKGSASNLAGQGPDVGIRLELPNHLKSSMKSLQQLSYDIKQTHPHSRRNVLFDDDAMDLVLDICVAEGQPWKRITSSQAKDRLRRKKRPAVAVRSALDDDELDKILDGDDPASNK